MSKRFDSVTLMEKQIDSITKKIDAQQLAATADPMLVASTSYYSEFPPLGAPASLSSWTSVDCSYSEGNHQWPIATSVHPPVQQVIKP